MVDGEIAVVTGASQGLGRAVAREIVARGGRVAGFARGRAPLSAAREEMGDRFLPVVADLADAQAVAAGYAAVGEAFGAPTILVNAAGVYRAFAIEDATDADFKDHIDANFLGALNMIRAAVPWMKRAGRGDIVNVTSESVHRPFPFLSVYGATKAALEAVSAGLIPELREYDIRVGVFRVGRMHSEGAAATMAATQELARTNPAFVERYQRLVTAGGYFHDVGAGMEPAVPARALVDTVTLPRGVSASHMIFQSR